MPYKWKDNENIRIKHKKIYTIIIIGMMGIDTFDILFHKVSFSDCFNLALGTFLLWGMWMNGFYRISRKVAEWKMKRRDNRFDYFSR